MPAALNPILNLIAQSALYTDKLQTQHWIDGTKQKPVRSPNGFPVYEVNPIVASRPELREPYFRFLGDMTELMTQYMEPPLSTLLLGAWALSALANVAKNNGFSKTYGFPQYWGLSYRWRF